MISPSWLTLKVQIVVVGVLLLIIAALFAATFWYRSEAADAERDLAEFKGAYDLLAQSVQRQNQSIQEADRAATAAAQRGQRARQEAAGAIEVAMKSADALGRAVAAPRVDLACPAGEGLGVVRKDWSSTAP